MKVETADLFYSPLDKLSCYWSATGRTPQSIALGVDLIIYARIDAIVIIRSTLTQRGRGLCCRGSSAITHPSIPTHQFILVTVNLCNTLCLSGLEAQWVRACVVMVSVQSSIPTLAFNFLPVHFTL